MGLRARELPRRSPVQLLHSLPVEPLPSPSAGKQQGPYSHKVPMGGFAESDTAFPGGVRVVSLHRSTCLSGHCGRRQLRCAHGGAASTRMRICIQVLLWEKLHSQCRVLCLKIIPL